MRLRFDAFNKLERHHKQQHYDDKFTGFSPVKGFDHLGRGASA